jgi:hypothetical protein
MLLKRNLPLLLLIVLFALSIVVRIGAFSQQPLTHYNHAYDRFTNLEVYHHLSYVVNDIYAHYPIAKHKFAGYFPEGDPRFLHHRYLPVLVYMSFPPTVFIVPYVFFKILGIGATFQAMEAFGLLIHLISVILLYYLLLAVLPKGNGRRRQTIAVLGASIYIFSTGTLHNHMSVFWSHQLLQPALIGSLLLFTKKRGMLTWWQSLAVGFTLSVITWTGVVASAGFVLYGLFQFWRSRRKGYLWSAVGVAGGAMLALAAVIGQVLYTTGASIGAYASKVGQRIDARSPLAEGSVMHTVRRFLNDLFLDYGAFFLATYSLLLLNFRKLKPSLAWAVVFLAAFPVLESFPLLAHDTTYAFGRLKWLLPVILVFSLLSHEFLDGTKKRLYTLVGIVAAASLVHILLYLDIYFFSK